MPQVRVLVVDDSATVRAIVEQIIEQDPDCRVVGVAADIDAARTMIAECRPNLITLDLKLPGLGGLDFLDELARQPHAPVVVLSSATTDQSSEAAEALARGADACFDKARIVADAPRFRRLLKRAVARHERRLLHPKLRH